MPSGDLRLLGFNIGNAMIVAYNPINKTVETISAARIPIGQRKNPQQISTVQFQFEPIDYDLIDRIIKPYNIILAMTDGIWQELTVSTTKLSGYEIISMDHKFADILSTLPVDAHMALIIQQICNHVLSSVESKRQSGIASQSPLGMYGDDASIIALRLPPPVQVQNRSS